MPCTIPVRRQVPFVPARRLTRSCRSPVRRRACVRRDPLSSNLRDFTSRRFPAHPPRMARELSRGTSLSLPFARSPRHVDHARHHRLPLVTSSSHIARFEHEERPLCTGQIHSQSHHRLLRPLRISLPHTYPKLTQTQVVVTTQLTIKLFTPDGEPSKFQKAAESLLIPQLGESWIGGRAWRVVLYYDLQGGRYVLSSSLPLVTREGIKLMRGKTSAFAGFLRTQHGAKGGVVHGCTTSLFPSSPRELSLTDQALGPCDVPNG